MKFRKGAAAGKIRLCSGNPGEGWGGRQDSKVLAVTLKKQGNLKNMKVG